MIGRWALGDGLWAIIGNMKTDLYKNLDVWQYAMDLTIETYKLTKLLPNEEKFTLSDQMRRAAVSIPSNIAEGIGRGTEKETVRFLYISKGSLLELETQLEICKRLDFISDEDHIRMIQQIASINKMLNALIKYRSDYLN